MRLEFLSYKLYKNKPPYLIINQATESLLRFRDFVQFFWEEIERVGLFRVYGSAIL